MSHCALHFASPWKPPSKVIVFDIFFCWYFLDGQKIWFQTFYVSGRFSLQLDNTVSISTVPSLPGFFSEGNSKDFFIDWFCVYYINCLKICWMKICHEWMTKSNCCELSKMRTGTTRNVIAGWVLQGCRTSRTDLASTESDTFDIWCQSHRPAVPNFVGLDKSEKKHFTMNETKLVNNNFSSQNG